MALLLSAAAWGVASVPLIPSASAFADQSPAPYVRVEGVPHVEIPADLHIDDALQIFRKNGLDLLIAEAAVTSAEGDVHIAGAVPNPNWGVGIYKSFFTPASTFATDLGWFASLGDSAAIEDSLSGKRGLRLDVAHAALAAARMSRVDSQRTLEFQVKQQYLLAVLAQDQLDFAHEVQTSNSKTYELYQVKYKTGQISDADVARVQTAKLEADQAVDLASQALRQAKVGVAFLLGVRGRIPEFKVEQDLPKYAVSKALASATADSLLESAYDHRPDLKAIRLQRERAEASISLAKRLRFPDLALGFGYSQEGGYNDSNAITPPTLQVSLGGTFPVFYQQQGEIKKAEADLRTQTLQTAKTEAQVASDVEGAYTAVVATRHLVERMESGGLLDSAKRALVLVQKQKELGSASLLEYLDAQRTYIAVNVEYLQDLSNYWTAVFLLEQAVGADLR
jgi:cobalt-zinc-cadmium efflux system outer membrane protein